jgi:hypothetical protein
VQGAHTLQRGAHTLQREAHTLQQAVSFSSHTFHDVALSGENLSDNILILA